MRTHSFWRQLLLALALSVLGVILHTTLSMFLGVSVSIRLSLLTLTLAYLLFLIQGSPVRSGRLMATLAYFGLCGLLIVLNPPLWLWLLLLTGFIWLLRSLQSYDSLIPAAIDALLCALALAAAIATARHSGSLFLSLWSYFLFQALLTLLPVTRNTGSVAAPSNDVDFDTSHRNAEAALRRLSLRS
jgi:hypothetical protein